ncbi:hemagglutinin repeat-containing protein, partial [Glaciimonas sp. Cout2]
MNKQAYRIIFNHARGERMVVAENVSGGGGKSKRSSGPVRVTQWSGLRFIPLSLIIAALFGSVTVVQAQIIADPNAGAHRPTVDQTANGRPLVQITAPNASGLSHNQYRQFDVNNHGAILNNARGITGTQQGGLVDGNPALRLGSARIILNEVRGGGRSQLSGFTEVAGQRAEVIIANPNGITCSGCGFINTTRGVLTTGTPMFGGDSSLQAFRVTGGDIRIDDLQGTNTSQLDLISRSVQVNGQLWADRLNVVAGTNHVNYADLGVQVMQGDDHKPTVSIDVALLGGMYANKIHLIGTEAGVGVVSMGTLAAQAGDISIDSHGKITLNGQTNASGQITLRSDDDVTNTGTLYGQHSVHLASAGNVSNTGTLAAQHDMTIHATSLDSTGILAAGIDAKGHATLAGNLHLSASGMLSATGQNSAGGNIAMSGGSVHLANAQTSAAGNITLTATAGDINHTGGNLQSSGVATLSATGALINDRGVFSSGQWRSQSARLSNRGGTLTQSGAGEGTLATISTNADIDNSGGVLSFNADHLTLQAGSLRNDAGTIQHAGSGVMRLDSGALRNVNGSIGSNGQLTLTAAGIDNRGGTLFAQGRTRITTTQGGFDNRAGYLGGSQLALHIAAQLNNTAGKIEATQNGLNITAQSLQNAGGTLQSLAQGTGSAALSLWVTQGIDNGIANNTGGFIGSAGMLDLHAANFDNSGGTLYANDDLTLVVDGGGADDADAQITGQVDNTDGVIQSGGNVNVQTSGGLTNRNGRIEANGSAATLRIASSNLDNSAGRIANSGTGATQIDGGDQIINAHAGTIGGNGDVILTSAHLDNSADGQIVAAGNLTLATRGLFNNNAGSVYAGRDLRVSDSHHNTALTNIGGQLGAAGTIALAVASLDNSAGVIANTGGNKAKEGSTSDILLSTSGSLTNNGGTIASGRDVTIDAATLTGEGTLIAGQDATLHLQSDYRHTAGNTFLVNRDLTLTTTGTLTNSGDITAVRHLHLRADMIDNQHNGLINSGEGSAILHAVHTLHNTGRIYGNDIVIGAHTLINASDPSSQQAGVIASRNTLQIGADTIINREHALLQSMGDMVLGGGLDADGHVTGNATVIRNSSATIDAGGALSLSTAALINENNHFSTGLQNDPALTRHVTEYRAWNSDIWYRADQISLTETGKGGIVLVVPGGARFEKFYKRDYQQTVQHTVVTHSDPGMITSGGNMLLSGTIINDKSTIIAGGTLSGNAEAIHNLGAAGEIRTTQTMTAGQNYYHWVSGSHHDNHYQYDNDGAAYDVVLPSVPLALAVWTQQDHTQPVTGPNHAVGNGVDSGDVPLIDGSELDANAADKTLDDGARHTVGTATTPLPNLVLPNNGLFIVHPQPGQPYLIETDPAFTNYKQFISSDYLLRRLSFDPQRLQKRLGDGYYEQKLINDQIAELTGKRFLGDYTNNETQYQALMEAGVASADAFQLTPGIALSAAQMAALTTDMVWLVSQTVTLADGSQTQVLAPVVYLSRASAGDIAPTGSLIAAHDIDLTVNGSLNNGGTLQAANNLVVHAADIANSGKLRSTGKTGSTLLIAQNDILNSGGSISGHRVGLLAGHDVTLRTDTTTSNSKNGTTIGIGSIASITADQLSIQAGRDINLVAATLNTTGDAALVAGRDLNLDTVTTQATSNVRYNDQNHLNERQTQVNGSAINAGGNLALIAGQDIHASAATVNAADQLAAVAGRDITIGTGQQSGSLDQAIHTTSKGLLSSSSSRSQANAQTTEAIGSSFTGKTIAMQSGRDTTIHGSQMIAENDLTLNAGRDVNITSAQQTSQNSFSAEETSNGLSANFMSGLSYSKTAQDQAQTDTSIYQIGSDISGANVHINSGRDTTITASAITADQDISIGAGRNINVLAAANTQTSDTSSHSSGTRMDITGGANARFTNYGTNSALQNSSADTTDYSTSLLSANGGNLNLQAGLDSQYRGTGQGNVTTQGAELLAKDTLNIGGNAVDLQAVHNNSISQYHAESHSVTLGSSLTGSIGGAVTRIGDMVAERQHTSNHRLKGALALKAGYDAYKLSAALPGLVDAANGSIHATQDVLAKKPPDPDAKGEGFGVSVSLGVGQSKQDSKNRATQARGTTAQASTINITSREGDIRMEGAKLQAHDISLDAARNIHLIAATNTTDVQSTNSGSNVGLGATLGSNGQQTGLSFQIGASASKGHTNGHETTYDNTQISATNHLRVKSGGDLNMIGAQLAANKVNLDIGGNLNILTQQDISNFDSKQENGGFSLSLCIPPICVGVLASGGVSYARQTVDHNYRSAVGQSGIAAGKGGFDINVKGNTDLTGAAITSQADADKNSLRTASLTSRDLVNTQHTDAESISVSLSTGSIASNVMGNVLGNLSGIGMPKNGDDRSNTNSVISPATVTITGSGDATTDANSKATANTLTERDATTANATLSNTLTLQQAQDLQLQQQQAQDNQRIAGLVGAVLTNMVGDLAQGKWPDGSPQKIALHGIVGLIEARIGGGSAAAGLAAGMMHEAMVPVLSDYLISQGYEPGTQDFNDMMSLGASLVGAASGALAGGSLGLSLIHI